MNSTPDTRTSLLIRVRDPADQAAWHEFGEIYRPIILRLARLKGLQDAARRVTLLDVRTALEHRICRLEDSKLIPLMELPERFSELEKSDEIVVYCHHGNRSARAVDFLRRMGFEKTKNLAGGIDAWSLEVDPSVPRY